jgi:hypothetical protein
MVWVIAYGMASGSHAEELWSEEKTTRSETRRAA